MSDNTILVAGCGLAGTMAALQMRRRGFEVILFDKRADSRTGAAAVPGEEPDAATRAAYGMATSTTKRSISLALSHRGQEALRRVGLLDAVMKMAIPMRGRVLHSKTGQITHVPYGINDQALYSVYREPLTHLLLDAAEAAGVQTQFERQVVRVSSSGNVTVQKPDGSRETLRGRLVLGADGAFSTVRAQLMRMQRVDFSQAFIEHGYIELTMPPTASGDYALADVNGLHIWPRGGFMMMATPNPDKSFTCTVFAPYEGKNGLSELKTREQVRAFFVENFPDAVPLLPRLEQEFFENPQGALGTMRTSPWNHEDKVALLGDAAHAVVPFFGQGMNAAFEDCLVLDELMDECDGDLSRAVPAYAARRKPATDALADLSLHNYMVMRDHTASAWFQARKKLETAIHKWFPDSFIPLYTMVSFTRIPYHEAVERSQRQNKVLNVIMSGALVGAAVVAGAAARRYLSSRR